MFSTHYNHLLVWGLEPFNNQGDWGRMNGLAWSCRWGGWIRDPISLPASLKVWVQALILPALHCLQLGASLRSFPYFSPLVHFSGQGRKMWLKLVILDPEPRKPKPGPPSSHTLTPWLTPSLFPRLLSQLNMLPEWQQTLPGKSKCFDELSVSESKPYGWNFPWNPLRMDHEGQMLWDSSGCN